MRVKGLRVEGLRFSVKRGARGGGAFQGFLFGFLKDGFEGSLKRARAFKGSLRGLRV